MRLARRRRCEIDASAAGDRPAPIDRVRTVEVFANDFGRLYNDEVLSARGVPGRYLRWDWDGSGVVVVPRRGDLYALVPMFRYPIGAVSLEFPRGGREEGESAEQAGLRELREESGLIARSARFLGRVHAETGLIQSGIDVLSAEITEVAAAAKAEVMESVAEPVWLSRADLAGRAAQGEIFCGVTLAALALTLLG